MRNRLFILGFGLTLALSARAGDRDYLDWSGVREAWQITKGAGVTIASLNTGVNYSLPEFRGRIAREPGGAYGFDAVTGRHDPIDRLDLGLGTQVASVAAGNLYGVAPAAQLVPVRIFDENGTSSFDAVGRGVDYAVSRGARVIEIGGGPFELERGGDALCASFRRAEDSGSLLVFSVGNSGESVYAYPSGCDLRNAVTVAAVDGSGDLAAYSNFGSRAVDLAAPAQNLWRVGRDGSLLKTGQGTSFASAFAAGVAALVWSAHPGYAAADVKAALIRAAVARDSLRGKILANGYLNAVAALRPAP